MKLRATTIYADAWAAWRRDWNVLTAVAGMFVFLPQLAILLVIIPAFPDLSKIENADLADPAFRAGVQAVQAWMTSYGLAYLVAMLVVVFGQFAIVALYLAEARATVGQALATALRLLPRLVLAWAVWSLPLMFLSPLLVLVPFLIVPLVTLILARMLLVAPAILAARPIGALAAIRRSFTLTRGHMLLLASVVLSIVLAQYLLAMPFLSLDQWMTNNAPNPVARTMVDAIGAAIAALAAIATALVQVAAWRRLSPSSS